MPKSQPKRAYAIEVGKRVRRTRTEGVSSRARRICRMNSGQGPVPVSGTGP
jgi:hypothetical protein